MSGAQRPKISSAYAIFEGGGAKGIAHIGALKAFEETDHAIIGVAGTSAGAIVAALIAVGYSADEIYSNAQDNILRKFGFNNPIEVIGKRDWYKFRATIKSFKWIFRIFLFAQLLCGISLIISASRLFLFIPWIVTSLTAIFGLVISVLCLAFLGGWVWSVLRKGGIFDASRISDLVNKALREKLREHYAALGIEDDVPERVLFRHIDPSKVDACIPLKIVVTNVTKGELELFDRNSPDVCVSDVVAASAGLPIVFRPAAIPSYGATENCRFSDGGLVSNLPSWVFKDEKRQRERDETAKGGVGRIPIYAFSLSSGAARKISAAGPALKREAGLKGMRETFPYFRQVLQAGIFGSQAVVADFVSDLRVISIPCALDTIDLDCTAERADKAHVDGWVAASQFLEREALRAEVTEEALRYIHKEVSSELKVRRNGSAPKLRVALIDPVSAGRQRELVGFRVSHGANMDQDADDRLDLDARTSIAAQAFQKREAFYGEVAGLTAQTLRMTKYERALLPPDMASVIAIPIFPNSATEGNPQRVLAIDSSDQLLAEFSDRSFITKVQRLSIIVSRLLIENTVKEALEE